MTTLGAAFGSGFGSSLFGSGFGSSFLSSGFFSYWFGDSYFFFFSFFLGDILSIPNLVNLIKF